MYQLNIIEVLVQDILVSTPLHFTSHSIWIPLGLHNPPPPPWHNLPAPDQYPESLFLLPHLTLELEINLRLEFHNHDLKLT